MAVYRADRTGTLRSTIRASGWLARSPLRIVDPTGAAATLAAAPQRASLAADALDAFATGRCDLF
jgi:hypothetical protein